MANDVVENTGVGNRASVELRKVCSCSSSYAFLAYGRHFHAGCFVIRCRGLGMPCRSCGSLLSLQRKA